MVGWVKLDQLRQSKCGGHLVSFRWKKSWIHPSEHGSLNVPIEHHPTIGYMVYNGYYKVMSTIPKMGQLPTPAE